MTDAATTSATPEPKSPRSRLKYAAVAAGAALLIAGIRVLPIQSWLDGAIRWIESLGPAGVVAFILLYIFAAICLVSGAALTLGAGAIFGVVEGSIYVSIASTLGAIAAFLIARYGARGWAERKIAGNARFDAIDRAVGREGWKIVGLTRLSPVFPYTLLNYAYGVTRVSLRDYALASWIGMIPGTIMYVYFGSAGRAALNAAAGDAGRSPGEWGLFIVGLAATVAVTVFVTKIAKKALNERVKEV